MQGKCAGFWLRVAAFVLDYLPVSLYFALSEASTRQATWGKQKVGLQVMRSDGTPLSLARALARMALKFTPWGLSHTLLWQLTWVEPEGLPLIYGGIYSSWRSFLAMWRSCYAPRRTRHSMIDWLAVM